MYDTINIVITMNIISYTLKIILREPSSSLWQFNTKELLQPVRISILYPSVMFSTRAYEMYDLDGDGVRTICSPRQGIGRGRGMGVGSGDGDGGCTPCPDLLHCHPYCRLVVLLF